MRGVWWVSGGTVGNEICGSTPCGRSFLRVCRGAFSKRERAGTVLVELPRHAGHDTENKTF